MRQLNGTGRIFAVTLVLVFGLLAAPACGAGKNETQAGWPETLRFGLIPTEANVGAEWQPIFDHLESELGRPVESFVGADYTATINAARDKRLDVVQLGPKSYVTARRQGADLQPLVKQINRDSGLAGYNSLLIAHVNSGIASIEDAKGRTFAFNDPESTSGFLLPTVFFLELGIMPEDYFSQVSFAGSHEATLLAVANREVDLASNNNENLPRMFAADRVRQDDIRIIWESPLIPTDPISVQAAYPESFKAAVRDAFLSFDDPATLDALQIRGWTTAADADYEIIRTLEATSSRLAEGN